MEVASVKFSVIPPLHLVSNISEFYSMWREHCQQLFSLFDWLLKKVHKISLVKKLAVWQLKVELESLHKLKSYPSVLLLMIKMSQSVCEKLDSYCKKLSYYTTREDTVSVICHEAVHVMSTVQTKTGRIFIE